MSAQSFFESLPVCSSFEEANLIENQQRLPRDWYLLISDISDSTDSIEQGYYRQVNTLGASTIIAVLNAIDHLDVPYAFGGDGSVICVPESLLEKSSNALAATALIGRKAFNFELRTGVISVAEVEEAGYFIRVSRYQLVPGQTLTIFSGGGIGYAESRLKAGDPEIQLKLNTTETADLSGLECRWNPVPGPFGAVLSLLVKATTENGDEDALEYKNLNLQMQKIYGNEQLDSVINSNQLSLSTGVNLLSTEAAFRNRKIVSILAESFLGKFLIRVRARTKNISWGQYRQDVVTHTEFRRYVDCYSHLISGSEFQHECLEEYLEERYQQGRLVYGSHYSSHVLLTCMVFDRSNNHLHFADGDNGGYSMAARSLKSRMQQKTPLYEPEAALPDSPVAGAFS